MDWAILIFEILLAVAVFLIGLFVNVSVGRFSPFRVGLKTPISVNLKSPMHHVCC